MSDSFPLGGGPHHFFCEKLTQCRGIQHRICQKPLQLAVLVLQSFQALGIGHVHPAELRPPVIQRGFRDAVLAGQVSRLHTSLMLPQNSNDLLFRKPLPLHCPSPSLGRTLNLSGGNLQWQVTQLHYAKQPHISIPRTERIAVGASVLFSCMNFRVSYNFTSIKYRYQKPWRT